MKIKEVNYDSWHYKLADSVGWNEETGDWCSYCRRVFLGLILITLLIVLTGTPIILYTVFLGDFIAWAVASIMVGQLIHLGQASVIGLVVTIATMGVFIPEILSRCLNTSKTIGIPQIIPQDTKDFFSDWYSSFKEKYCFKVKVK